MVPGILLPLWVVLALLGSTLGLSPEQIHDKNVYVSADEGRWMTGIACDWELFPDDGAGWFDDQCAGLPPRTAVIYWRNVDPAVYGDDYVRYVVRHEVEHLLRGRDGPAGDVNNEAAAKAAGCSVAPGWWCDW
ncbi:MAG: hypothetical protein AB7I38_14955 [Dehalococcoidia bacterium]